MLAKPRLKPLAFIVLLGVLAACGGPASAPAPAVEQAAPPSAAVIAPTETLAPSTPFAPPPTYTAMRFELRPSSTPIPSATPFVGGQPAGSNVISYGPNIYPENVNPLTGLDVPDLGLLNRRPMLVKISNFPRDVRPQWGLSQADHVYEYYLEAGLTRFAAVFYGNNVERVGPVRSARIFDENLVRTYKPYFIFGYADDRIWDELMASEFRDFVVIEKPDNCPPLCRIGPETSYNTLFLNTLALQDYVSKRGTPNDRPDLTGLRFYSLNVNDDTESGLKISIRFSADSYNRWEFDPQSGRYLRFQETRSDSSSPAYAPLKDAATGEQIGADNVVILMLPFDYYMHTHSTDILSIDFVNAGSGYAFRDGAFTEIVWRRPTPGSMLEMETKSGRPFGLKPGTSWFEIVSDITPVEKKDNGEWIIRFKIPPAPVKYFTPVPVTSTP